MIPGRRPVQLHAAALIDQDAPLRTPSRTTGRRRPPTGSIRQLMKSAAQHRPEDEPTAHNRLRFEAISASIWLAFGLFALPAAIYAVGTTRRARGLLCGILQRPGPALRSRLVAGGRTAADRHIRARGLHRRWASHWRGWSIRGQGAGRRPGAIAPPEFSRAPRSEPPCIHSGRAPHRRGLTGSCVLQARVTYVANAAQET